MCEVLDLYFTSLAMVKISESTIILEKKKQRNQSKNSNQPKLNAFDVMFYQFNSEKPQQNYEK